MGGEEWPARRHGLAGVAAIAARVERAIEHASESSARDVLAAQQEARALIGFMLFPFPAFPLARALPFSLHERLAVWAMDQDG